MANGTAAAHAARSETRGSYRLVALLLLPTVALLGAAFVYPMSNVLAQAFYDDGFTGKHFQHFLTTPLYPKILLNTLKVSLCVAGLSALFGYPAAYFLAHVTPRYRAALIFLILLPLWVSILVRSYSWMVLLGRQGLINSFLLGTAVIDQPLTMLYTTGAVYMAMVQIMLPIMILSCYAIMIRVEPDLARAARALGATETKAFWYVFFPQTLGGLRSGTIIIFILSMGYFITPALVGSRKDMMIGTLIVFQIDELANWQFAAAIGLILLIATLAVTALIGLAFRGLHFALSRMI
jgi:putative spermidine/putrescine transport system permease protein